VSVISNDNNIGLTSEAEQNSKKLLNETPVANPKQLPKKTNVHETSSNSDTDKLNNMSPILVQVVTESKDSSNLFMPVITSTTSLANISEAILDGSTTGTVLTAPTKGPTDIAKVSESAGPRIKVKPVSELMNPVNILKPNESLNIWNTGSVEGDRILPNANGFAGHLVIEGLAKPQIQTLPAPNYSTALPTFLSQEAVNNNSTESIILDTVEFPNTKTQSPFNYFKMLLALHNISLLEPNAPILRDYVCLLKIKVHFKQESKAKAVVLCLSVFCLQEAFCICIKDTNQIDIQMTKISANWQWEIMKIFQGDVSNKILQNAEKAGPDIYTKAKTFLCLLKSINCRQA
jgi:hypothetical protein